MKKSDFGKLINLLLDAMREAPCHGGRCVGFQNCGYGENNIDEERCAIEDVIDMLPDNIKLED